MLIIDSGLPEPLCFLGLVSVVFCYIFPLHVFRFMKVGYLHGQRLRLLSYRSVPGGALDEKCSFSITSVCFLSASENVLVIRPHLHQSGSSMESLITGA